MNYKFRGFEPNIAEGVFVAEGVHIIGDVTIEDESSIWFNTVIRADNNSIKIGRGSNIQDNCILHINVKGDAISIGENVTVGHGVILHGCTIGNNVVIGMGSTILDGAVIGENTIIGACSLVTSNKVIPGGVLCVGSPAKIVRNLRTEELNHINEAAEHYKMMAKEYKCEGK